MPLKIRPNAIEQDEGRFPFPGIILNDDLTIDDGAFIDTKGGSGTIHYDGLSLHSLDPQTTNDKPLQLRGSTAGIFLDTGEEVLLAQSSLVEWNRPRNNVDHRWWSQNYGAALHVDGQFARVGVAGVTAPLFGLHVGGGNMFLSGTAYIDGAVASDVGIALRAGGILRWFMRRTAGGEDFAVTRYSPSGTFLGTEFLISDVTGDTTIAKNITVQRGLVANYDGGNYDTRIASQNLSHAIFVDANQDRVGLGGITSPTYGVHIGQPLFVSGTIDIGNASGLNYGLAYYTDDVLRWLMRQSSTGEWRLTRYDSGGSFQDNPITVNDADGSVSLYNGLIVNAEGGDHDTQIQTQNLTHALFADAGLDRIGMLGVSSPTYPLHIGGEAYVSGSVHVDGPAGYSAGVRLRTANVMSWFLRRTEAGRFAVARYDGGGSYIDDPFVIDDGTGNIGLHVGSPTYGVHIGQPAFVSGTLTIGNASSLNSVLYLRDTSAIRWGILRDAGAEIRIARYDSGGVFQDYPLTIHSDDGRVVLATDTYISGQNLFMGVSDSRMGVIRLFGHETGTWGGRIQFYTAADSDDEVDQFVIDAQAETMRFWTYHATYGASVKSRLLTGSWQFDIPLGLRELAADPATPSSGYGRVFARDDGRLYWLDDSGNSWDLISGGFS